MTTLFLLLGLVALFLAAAELFKGPDEDKGGEWGDDSPLMNGQEPKENEPNR